jgi:hypothetical protein
MFLVVIVKKILNFMVDLREKKYGKEKNTDFNE